VLTGIAIAVVIGAVSGLVPAVQASRLRIVDALRRVE
jgi:ABC-type antimicrobial peptide transport system permease subunit